MDINKMKRIWMLNAKRIAKRNTNYDTGNIVNNAIKARSRKRGFIIEWDESNAYYIKFVNDGFTHYFTGEKVEGSKFDERTWNDIAKMIDEGTTITRFVDRPSARMKRRREKRLRESQKIWQNRKYDRYKGIIFKRSG